MSRKQNRNNLISFSQCHTSVNWSNVFPLQGIKSLLYENEELGSVGKDAIKIIGECTAVLIADLVHATIEIQRQGKTQQVEEESIVIDKSALEAAIDKVSRFDFLKDVLENIPSQSKATIFSFDKTKHTKRKKVTAKAKEAPAGIKKAKKLETRSVVAESTNPTSRLAERSLIEEAVRIANLQPHYLDTNTEIVLDEDDYD